MSRYIDADELIMSIKEECSMCELNQSCDSCMVTEGIKDIHRFADLHRAAVKPIVRGEWMFAGDGIVECSECKETYESNVIPRNFCPNCGADMRGKEK